MKKINIKTKYVIVIMFIIVNVLTLCTFYNINKKNTHKQTVYIRTDCKDYSRNDIIQKRYNKDLINTNIVNIINSYFICDTTEHKIEVLKNIEQVFLNIEFKSYNEIVDNAEYVLYNTPITDLSKNMLTSFKLFSVESKGCVLLDECIILKDHIFSTGYNNQ